MRKHKFNRNTVLSLKEFGLVVKIEDYDDILENYYLVVLIGSVDIAKGSKQLISRDVLENEASKLSKKEKLFYGKL